MTNTTVRKNTKRFKRIIDNAINLKSYTLDNGFRGEAVELRNADGDNWLEVDFKRFHFMKLKFNGINKDGDETYTAHYHSNEWVTFENAIIN